MAQDNLGDGSGVVDPAVESGISLAAMLMAWRDALHSMHSGTSAPAYCAKGMLWLDTASNPNLVKLYDGTSWATLASLNTTTHALVLYTGGSALGSAATATVGVSANNVVALDGAGKLPAVDGSALTGLLHAVDIAGLGLEESGGKLQLKLNGTSIFRDASGTKVKDGLLPPTGAIFPYAGATAPTGYLLCYGQAVSRSTYADLFAVTGVAYGVGDGVNTFNLPDLRGRVPVGKDNMGGTAASRVTTAVSGVDGATLGASGGEQAHALTLSENGAHYHTYSKPGAVGAASLAAGTDVSIDTMAHTASSGNSDAHNTMQPSQITTYIIKT